MIQTGKLTASAGSDHDFMGQSVAINPGGDTIMVGTPAVYPRTGSGYTFNEPVGGWTDMHETSNLVPADGGDEDYFGTSVAIDSNTLFVGAPGHNIPALGGAAYVFGLP